MHLQYFFPKNKNRVSARAYTRTRRSRPQRSAAYLQLLPAKSSTLCSHASSICAMLALRSPLLSFALHDSVPDADPHFFIHCLIEECSTIPAPSDNYIHFQYSAFLICVTHSHKRTSFCAVRSIKNAPMYRSNDFASYQCTDGSISVLQPSS
uniref:Uncharacterized protein n=1 Tax=Eubacterium cellulosolvens (strain ATCC 43171 / JCM 9499 / 6) TaxID=633697 RepID=I5AUY9_EUBC6